MRILTNDNNAKRTNERNIDRKYEIKREKNKTIRFRCLGSTLCSSFFLFLFFGDECVHVSLWFVRVFLTVVCSHPLYILVRGSSFPYILHTRASRCAPSSTAHREAHIKQLQTNDVELVDNGACYYYPKKWNKVENNYSTTRWTASAAEQQR